MKFRWSTKVGVMKGAGAAKTGLSWMREGKEEEEEEEDDEVGGVSVAKTQEGRNVALLREVLAETEEGHKPLIEAIDIVQKKLEIYGYIGTTR